MASKNNTIDFKLVGLFLAITAQILIMSYMFPKGGLTSDSKSYLLLAQSMGDGSWFWVPDLVAENGKSFFGLWPIGYSAMVAGISAVLPVDLVFASKLLNIFLIGFTLWVFSKIFGKDAFLFGSVFFLDSIVRLTYRSWVQTPFLIGFILLAVALYKLYYNRDQLRWMASIILIGMFLFVVRYSSITSLIAIGILGCYLFYRKDYKTFSKLAFCGFSILGFAAIYCYHNYQNVGSITGLERLSNPEDLSFMFKRLFSRLLEECKIPGIALVIAYIAHRYFNYSPKNPKKEKGSGQIWPFFLLVGATYLSFVIILRFNIQFDDFGGRMFGPATILFVIALLDYLRANHKHFQLYRNCILAVFLGSFIYHAPVKAAKAVFDDKPNYLEYRAQKEQEYANLEERSIVLFGTPDLIYLKDNVQPASLFPFMSGRVWTKYADFAEDIGQDEPLAVYTHRRCKLPINAIYMDVSNWRPKPQGGYKAIQQFVDANKGKKIIKIADCTS